MRKVLLMMFTSVAILAATPRFHSERYRFSVRPTPQYYGYAYGSAVAVGVLGYELGRLSRPRTVIIQSVPPSPDSCRTVQIEHDQRVICRDATGNWLIVKPVQ